MNLSKVILLLLLVLAKSAEMQFIMIYSLEKSVLGHRKSMHGSMG